MEPAERASGSPAKARLPGQAGEETAAELSFKPPDEIPTTAAELILALLPLGDSPGGREAARVTGNRWLPGLQRRGRAVRVRIRGKYK